MVIVVEIEDRCDEKPFLGGWRNVVTGAEYHDAGTQTRPGDRVYPGPSAEVHGVDGEGGGGVCRASVGRTANVITQTPNGNSGAREKSVGTRATRSRHTSVSTVRATQTSRLPDLRDKLVTPLAAKTTTTTMTTVTPPEGDASPDHRKTKVLAAASSCETERSRRHCRDDAEDEEKHFSGPSRLEDECAVKIQKCYRAYRARGKIAALARLSRETRAQTPPSPETVHRLRHCRSTQFEIVNAAPPRGRSDFEMLENVLGRWRVHENARVDQSFFGTSRLAARTTVLLKEIELLRSIEAIRTRVRLERRQRRYLEHLDKLARPEVWNVANGRKIHVDTLRVQRARECRDFYAALLREDVATSQRIAALTSLRTYTLGHTCRLGEDLLSLIGQELELLSHSVDSAALVSLRNRLKLALLRLSTNFCEPRRRRDDGEGRRKNYVSGGQKANSKLCNRCEKFLHLEDFPSCVLPGGSDFVTCENCRDLRAGKEPKVVYEPYELMLRELRSREAAASCVAGEQATSRSPAFAVDPRVIYRLVNYVWHGKSGISECDDLFRLTLVRFRPDREWSPWNTLVLTKREAALHRAMPDPWQIYAPGLVKKFVVKNLQAKLRFDFVAKTKFSLTGAIGPTVEPGKTDTSTQKRCKAAILL